MRLASKCVPLVYGSTAKLDVSPEEFAQTMRYGARRYADADEFFSRHSAPWIEQLHAALEELLEPGREVVSLGSGECEHEIPFVVRGYAILASDLVPGAADETRRLFPSLRFRQFDILHPDATIGLFDDVLITGLDFYYGDEELDLMLRNVRALLRPGGRLIFVLRYRDNWGTWLIDRVGIPVVCRVFMGLAAVKLTRKRFGLKPHGYRRSIREVTERASTHGFRLNRLRYAGFGVELSRLYLDRFVPPAYRLLAALDRRLHWFTNATVFEFLT